MKLTKSVLREMIQEVLKEAWPKKGETDKEPEGPKQASTDIMDNPFDEKEKEDDEDDEDKKEESISSKLKKEEIGKPKTNKKIDLNITYNQDSETQT